MLTWDISKDSVGEMVMGFALDEVETDGVQWARRPKIRLGHKESAVKDDRGRIPRVRQFRVQPPDVGGESEIEEGTER
jgi:hypothetical protein